MVRDSTVLFAVFGVMLAVFAALWRNEIRFYTELSIFLLGFATLAFLIGAMMERAAEREKESST
ncbi:MAG: hypothetical protein KY455_13820 [Euryarchaeota archaeon]|nr:hypothetical protein [Euryarchaeota archaeon]